MEDVKIALRILALLIIVCLGGGLTQTFESADTIISEASILQSKSMFLVYSLGLFTSMNL